MADNAAKHDITESERLLIGRDFGLGTDIESPEVRGVRDEGAILEIFRR